MLNGANTPVDLSTIQGASDINQSYNQYNNRSGLTQVGDTAKTFGQNLAQGSEVKKVEELIIYVPDIKTKFPDFIEEKWSLSDIQSFCEKIYFFSFLIFLSFYSLA